MNTDLDTAAAQDVERRGVAALEERLADGPVHVLEHNRPVWVVLSEADSHAPVDEAASARLAASLPDLREGRVRATTAGELLDAVSG